MKTRVVLKWVFLVLGLAGALSMLLSRKIGATWWWVGAGVWIVSLGYLIADDLARRRQIRKRMNGKRFGE